MHIPNKLDLRPSIHLSGSHEPHLCMSSLTMGFHGRKAIPTLKLIILLVEPQSLLELLC